MKRTVASAVVIGLAGTSGACFHGEHGFDREKKSQTTPFHLINERYAEEQKQDAAAFRHHLKAATEELEAKADDLDWQDDYAYLLFRTGQSQQALATWQEVLKKDPKRYATLCNLGTAYHGMSRFDEAKKYLEAAIALRPDFRGGAEKYHLQMVNYQHRQRTEPEYALNHLFVDDLTPFWKDRKAAPETLKQVKDFPKHSAEGVAELLRQYPRFGDGWLVLGMLLEHKGEHYLALRSYERSVRFGTSQQESVKRHLRTYSDYALRHDPPRSAARKLKWTFFGLVALGILFGILKFARAIVLDITSPDRKKAPLNPKRRK